MNVNRTFPHLQHLKLVPMAIINRPKPKGKYFRPQQIDRPDPGTEAPIKPAKSAFITVTHGLRKIKKLHHYKCKLCNIISESQATANAHYRTTHPQLSCEECKQLFNNPCSLRRHLYHHKELKYPCHSCDKYFAFESNLNNHCLKHRRHLGHQCNH